MKKLTLFILLTISILAQAQHAEIKTVKINEKYTWPTVTYQQFDSFYFNLIPLRNTNFKTHVRISLTGQTIDLYSIDEINYNGILTNYIMEYESIKVEGQNYNTTKDYQYNFQKIELDSEKVESLIKIIIISGQNLIPTDALTKAWNKSFLHCNSVRFEYNLNGKYHYQNLNCPWSQRDTFNYRNKIVSNLELLDSVLKLDSFYRIFQINLPKGKTYSRDGYIMMYKFTDEQIQRAIKNKPYTDYLDSIENKLNKYLSDTLTTLFKKYDDFCSGQFFLYFSSKNKLKKIEFIRQPIDLTERIEIYKCKIKIKKVFKRVKLDFVKSKIGYKKEFYYSDRNVRISQ